MTEETASSSSVPEPVEDKPSAVRSALGFALALAAIIAIRIVSEYITPLQSFHKIVRHYHVPLLAVSISLTALGALLTWGPWFLALFAGEGEAMTREEQLELSRHTVLAARTWSVVRFKGKMQGRKISNESSLAYLKQGLLSGAWRSDRQLRRLLLSAIGGLMMVFCGFTIPIIVGPAWVMLWIGPVIIYVAARLLWALMKA